MYWKGKRDVSTKDKDVNSNEEAMPIVQTPIIIVDSFSIRVQSQGLHFHPTLSVNNRCMTLFTLTVKSKMKRQSR